MNRPPMIVSDTSVCVVISGKQHTIDQTHLNYTLVRNAIREKRWDDLAMLVDVPQAIIKYSQGHYKITDEGVYYQGRKLKGALERRLMAFVEEGIDFEPLLKFHERIQSNPNKQSAEELYDFLEHKNIPIDEEGFFYAYKSVKKDSYLDHHTGTVSNKVGEAPSMPRDGVDANRNNHCSSGYHVGSLEYASGFQTGNQVLVICRIDPADVVSVPSDSSCQKVRVCRYQVVAEYGGPLPETLYAPPAMQEEDTSDADTEVGNVLGEIMDEDISDDDSDEYWDW